MLLVKMRFFTILFLLVCLICLLDAWGSRRRSSRGSRRRSSVSRYRSYRRYTPSRSRYRYRRTPVRKVRLSTRRRTSRVPTRRSSYIRRRTSRVTSRRTYIKRTRPLTRRFSRRSALVTKRGPLFSLRKRDETGHRTGLGTIARSFVKNPIKTIKSIGAFGSNYKKMREANVKGGNLKAHKDANYEATKIGGSKLAGGISALREQYKRFRIKKNPDGSKHYGDTRTAKEIKSTMDANKSGREKALKEIKG